MPKSHRRRARSPGRGTTPVRIGLRAQPSGVEPRRWQALLAEARGDAEAAQRLLTDCDDDGDTLLRDDLATMVRHGDQAPPWLLARWLTRQALRWMRLRRDDRYERARFLCLRGTYWWRSDVDVDDLPPAYARTLADDWVTREIALYGYRALDDYLDGVADPPLVDAAGDIRAWTRMPLRAYRLGAGEDDRLPVVDLTSSARHQVFDLGTGALYPAGSHVLGRLVPVGGDVLFETLPLLLDEQTAIDIATAGPPHSMNPVPWAPLLTRAIEQGRLPAMPGAGLRTPVVRDEPVAELPDVHWEPPLDPRLLSLTTAGLDDELAGWVLVLEEGLRILPRRPAAVATCVDALEQVLASPAAVRVVRERLTAPEFAGGWTALADQLAGELGRVCAELASAARGSR